eukprot:GFUD01082343.1.p1 GENE.GFUD01082343.1~~GFUD01082343.1.p1  ORF type:complete len:286 (+),score=62.64 GFUD01082343.1:124-981(+)
MSGPTISLGLGARGLKDEDWGPGVSDPYVTISRPDTTGGFTILRTSETKKNTLNPDWNDFLFIERELNGNDKELNIRIQVFDDDGKKGPDMKDKLLCSGFFSLKQLEAAALVNQVLPLSDGKKTKAAGHLLVRSFKEHNSGTGSSSGMYGAPPGTVGGRYPGQGTAYPPQPAGGYPQGGAGYPQGGGGYPQGTGYPQGGGSYPEGVGVYPQTGGAYPQGDGGYPQGAGGYPQGVGYPQGGGGGYPQGPAYPQRGAFPQGAGSFPTTDPMFPTSNLPAGGFYNPNM